MLFFLEYSCQNHITCQHAIRNMITYVEGEMRQEFVLWGQLFEKVFGQHVIPRGGVWGYPKQGWTKIPFEKTNASSFHFLAPRGSLYDILTNTTFSHENHLICHVGKYTNHLIGHDPGDDLTVHVQLLVRRGWNSRFASYPCIQPTGPCGVGLQEGRIMSSP